MKLNIKLYTLSGAGTEIDNFNVTDSYDEYLIKGTATAIGNYAISLTGTPQAGEFFRVKYKGLLDITTGSKTFSILGQNLTQNQLNSDLDIECFYDGSAWDVLIKPSFTSAVVEASNLTANAVTASAIANGSIDLGVKGTALSLITNRIADLAVTTAKINSLAVTDAKINDVNGSKLVDDTVTNAKLATMTASSVKIGGATGDPADLALGNNQVAAGNGTTIVAKDMADLSEGQWGVLNIPINFNTASATYRAYFPYTDFTTHIHTISLRVSEVFAGTDSGVVTVTTSAGLISNFNGVLIAASSTPGTEVSPGSPADNFDLTGGTFRYIDFTTNKPTSGGQIVAVVAYTWQ